MVTIDRATADDVEEISVRIGEIGEHYGWDQHPWRLPNQPGKGRPDAYPLDLALEAATRLIVPRRPAGG